MLPIGLCGLMVLAGTLFRKRWLSLAGVVLLWVAAMPFTGEVLSDPLERQFPEFPVAKCPPADAVVVLGGAIIRSVSQLGVQWANDSGRFFTAVDLKLAGKAKYLVITDAGATGDIAMGYAAILRAEAVRRGVPDADILVTEPVTTTADEAQAVARLPGVRTAIVVSNAFHLPRANMLFTAYGIKTIPFPMDAQDVARPPFNAQQLLPVAAGLYETDTAVREYYGLAVYRILLAVRPPGTRAR